MKVAILTLPFHTNYGGILQAYALQTYLQNRGHQVIVVNRRNKLKLTPKLLLLRIGSVIKSFIYTFFLKKKEYVVMNPLSSSYSSRWSGYKILPFVKEYINISKEIYSSEALAQYFNENKFDCYVVGSDQVWRPCYTPSVIDFFLKSVMSDLKAIKLAYAASFGTDKWEFTDNDTIECSSLVKLFNSISVREKSGIKLCKEYLDIDVIQLIDPTMLLMPDEYLTLINKTQIQRSLRDAFFYVLDANDEAERISEILNKDGYSLNRVTLTMQATKANPRPYQLSVEDWLSGLNSAEVIITDSFHACVFSILFKRPFVVLGNNKRGNARIKSLLEMFDMHDRLVESEEDFIKKYNYLLSNDDFSKVDNILSVQRKRSEDFFNYYGL